MRWHANSITAFALKAKYPQVQRSHPMRTILTILTCVCVLGLTVAVAQAGGPHHGVAVKVVPAGYYHGGYYAHHGYYARPYVYPAPVYVPYPAVYVPRPYVRPCYTYPSATFYYSTPGFSIGVGL
jgi:hypothetical protein